jgi:DNA-binding response OmpR family regulator
LPRGKVLVVDSDAEAREAIAEALVARGYDVVCARSGNEAVDKALVERPNAVALAVEMAGIDGVETCQEIRKTLFAPVILISERSEETDLVLGLGVGADYYVTKPVSMAQLLAYVEAAVRRETVYSRRRISLDTLKVKDLSLDLAAHELKRNGRTIQLSPTEFRLLTTLARNVGRILTRDQLLESVWELNADGIYSRTVDVHIGRIRRKIGDNAARQRYIVTVPGLGYKMRGA